jgi:hypothetical protein
MNTSRTHRSEKPALYPLLETGWYASEGQPYKKRYGALCDEFLLTTHRYLSQVKQQLDPAHAELQAAGFLAKHEYRKAREGQDWTITYWPGRKFFADHQTRPARRHGATGLAPPPPSGPALSISASLL